MTPHPITRCSHPSGCRALRNSSGLCPAHKRQADRLAAGLPTLTKQRRKAAWALGATNIQRTA